MWNTGHTWAVVWRAALSGANKAFSASAAQCPPNSFEAFLLNAGLRWFPAISIYFWVKILMKSWQAMRSRSSPSRLVSAICLWAVWLLHLSLVAVGGRCSKKEVNFILVICCNLSSYLWAEKACVLVGWGKAGAGSLGRVAGPARWKMFVHIWIANMVNDIYLLLISLPFLECQGLPWKKMWKTWCLKQILWPRWNSSEAEHVPSILGL